YDGRRSKNRSSWPDGSGEAEDDGSLWADKFSNIRDVAGYQIDQVAPNELRITAGYRVRDAASPSVSQALGGYLRAFEFDGAAKVRTSQIKQDSGHRCLRGEGDASEMS